ncbi:22033_t:CDS:2, partial [Dentiscutata erythropus]
RSNRLKRKGQAKYMHYQKLNQSIAEPSTRTRSQTSKASKASLNSRAKTKEGQKDRQQAHRASLSEVQKEKIKEKDRERYKKQKKEQFKQFYKIGYSPPPKIYYFLTEKDPISKVPFLDKIRAYNQAFAFISIATDLDLDVANEKKGAYCYRIQYHQISSALPEQGEIPKFSQIYFHDSLDIEAQIDRRHDVMKQSLNREMISIIQNVLIDLNPFVDTYISAENEDLQDPLYYILIHNKHGKDMRQYNSPLVKKVVAICFSDETMHVRDILIVRHDDELERISELHGTYDPLAYPFLFLCREYD